MFLLKAISSPKDSQIVAAALMATMAFLSGSVQAQRIKGSDTLLPLTQELAEEYTEESPSVSVTVTGGGSGVGISALIEGTTDIAMSSRAVRFSEKAKLRKAGVDLVEDTVAFDALAVIVNPGNPVSRLTREQLEAIYRGKITNWKELGGDDRRIVVYARETSSGTYEFFMESVLEGKNYMAGVLSLPATGAVIQSVRQTPGAIGYVGLAYLNPAVKVIAVSYDGGCTYTQPSVGTAIDGSYPVVRPLYFYYDGRRSAAVAPFLSYIKSEEGRRCVLDVGFVPVR